MKKVLLEDNDIINTVFFLKKTCCSILHTALNFFVSCSKLFFMNGKDAPLHHV